MLQWALHRVSCIFGVFALALLLLLGPSVNEAWAYLDPGTGSMMLQLLLGGIAGAMVVGRLYLKRIAERFRALVRRRRAS